MGNGPFDGVFDQGPADAGPPGGGVHPHGEHFGLVTLAHASGHTAGSPIPEGEVSDAVGVPGEAIGEGLPVGVAAGQGAFQGGAEGVGRFSQGSQADLFIKLPLVGEERQDLDHDVDGGSIRGIRRGVNQDAKIICCTLRSTLDDYKINPLFFREIGFMKFLEISRNSIKKPSNEFDVW